MILVVGSSPSRLSAQPDEPSAPEAPADASSDAEARALFQAGAFAFDAGRFEEALGHFQRSYELSRRPELWYNIGSTLDRLQREGEALEAFRAYLEALPDAPNAEQVRARIAFMERALEQRPDPIEAPTPVETAEAAEPPPEAAPEAAPEPVIALTAEEAGEPEERRPAYKAWWLWTIVGVAVAGGVTAGVLLTRDPGVEGPLSGNLGGVGGNDQGHVTVRTLSVGLGR